MAAPPVIFAILTRMKNCGQDNRDAMNIELLNTVKWQLHSASVLVLLQGSETPETRATVTALTWKEATVPNCYYEGP